MLTTLGNIIKSRGDRERDRYLMMLLKVVNENSGKFYSFPTLYLHHANYKRNNSFDRFTSNAMLAMTIKRQKQGQIFSFPSRASWGGHR